MKDEKEATIQRLLTESLRLRQIITKKYFELSIEMKSILDKKDLLNETIKNFNQKDGQLYIKLLEKQKELDDELTAINAEIAKNKALIKNSSGKKAASDIDKESAMFFMDNLNKTAEEKLRLTEDDKQRLRLIMAKLEPIITDRDVQKGLGFSGLPDTEGCLDCTNSCKGTCDGTCIGECLSNCAGSCLGPCEGSCGILCEGSCLGPCEGSCGFTCEGSCRGPIKAD